MATRLSHLVIDALEPRELAAFWSEALDWPVVIDDPHEVEIGPRSDGDVPLIFVPVREQKVTKNRIHIDLCRSSPHDQAAFVERLCANGAAPVDIGQGDVAWKVLADPEGNEFCVAGTSDFGAGTGAIGAIAFDAADPSEQGRFWSEATGWPVVDEGDWGVALHSSSAAGPFITMGPPVAPKRGKNRVHIDVRPEPGGDTGAEAERLVALGATRVDIGQRDVPWIVLADPEGNEFCVLTPASA